MNDIEISREVLGAETSKPFFSIIVPVYNVAQYLKGCLDSVLAQTYPNWECLCVDDGSTDESSAILDEYAQKDPRFRIFHKKNGGVGSARNCGVANACGDYVLFLDGDDAFVVTSFSALQSILKSSPVDILAFRSLRVKEHYAFVNAPLKGNAISNVYDMTIPHDIRMVFKCYAIGGLLAWGACYRKGLIDSIPFKQMPNGEDVLFGTETIGKAKTFANTTLMCYSYLNRVGSAVHTSGVRRFKSIISVIDELMRFALQYKYYVIVRSYFYRKLRVLLFGEAWASITMLSHKKQSACCEILLRKSREVFCRSQLAPVYLRCIYWSLLQLTYRTGNILFLRLDYELRKRLIRNSFIQKIWSRIR